MNNNYQKITTYEAKKGEFDKVLLLYSGGLDTSVMVKWLQEEYEVEVYTLTVDIGQVDDNMDQVKEKALKLGVKKAFVVDLKEEFAKDYLTKAIKSNADYQGGYHLFCPLGRAIISKKVVEVAQQEGIKVIAHGCTGKGNDQVRFDSYITLLDPSMKIIAPVREWSMGRSEEIKYAEKHGIPLSKHNPIYSYDENLWGCSAEGGEIKDVKLAPKLDGILIINELLEKASSESVEILIEFEKGVPVALNGQKLDLVNLLKALTKLGSVHGIGTKIFVEDRIVGLKVRGVYEQPAAEILVTAHKELEKLVSTKEENEFKVCVDAKWAYLCYCAKWYEPLMNDLNKFIDNVNEKVTGIVHLKLYKGNVMVLAIESKYSLVDSEMASFDNGLSFNQNVSAGFIELYGLQQKMAWMAGKK